MVDDLRAGHLVRVLADYEGPSRPIYLLFPTRRLTPPKLRAFVDHVVSALRHRTDPG